MLPRLAGLSLVLFIPVSSSSRASSRCHLAFDQGSNVPAPRHLRPRRHPRRDGVPRRPPRAGRHRPWCSRSSRCWPRCVARGPDPGTFWRTLGVLFVSWAHRRGGAAGPRSRVPDRGGALGFGLGSTVGGQAGEIAATVVSSRSPSWAPCSRPCCPSRSRPPSARCSTPMPASARKASTCPGPGRDRRHGSPGEPFHRRPPCAGDAAVLPGTAAGRAGQRRGAEVVARRAGQARIPRHPRPPAARHGRLREVVVRPPQPGAHPVQPAADGVAVLVALALVALVVYSLRFVRRTERGPPTGPGRCSATSGSPRRSTAHAPRGAGRAAVRGLRPRCPASVASGAVERTLLEDAPSLTAHEIAGRLGSTFPEQAQDLRAAADRFDAVAYGDEPASRADAEDGCCPSTGSSRQPGRTAPRCRPPRSPSWGHRRDPARLGPRGHRSRFGHPSPPAVGRRARRRAVLVVTAVVVGIRRNAHKGESLDPQNPGREGAQALASVLRDRGVDVQVVRGQQRAPRRPRRRRRRPCW